MPVTPTMRQLLGRSPSRTSTASLVRVRGDIVVVHNRSDAGIFRRDVESTGADRVRRTGGRATSSCIMLVGRLPAAA